MPGSGLLCRAIVAIGIVSALIGAWLLAGLTLGRSTRLAGIAGAEVPDLTAAGLLLGGVALALMAMPQTRFRRRLAPALALAACLSGLGAIGSLPALGDPVDGLFAPAWYCTVQAYGAASLFAIGLALAGQPVAALRRVTRLLAGLATAAAVIALAAGDLSRSGPRGEFVVTATPVPTALAFTLLGIGTLLLLRRRHAPAGAGDPRRSALESWMTAGLAATFVMLLIGAGVSVRTSADYVRHVQFATSIEEARALRNRAYASVSDAESAVRTYLLLNSARYRSRYEHHATEARQHAQALAATTSVDQWQQRTTERFNMLLDQRLDVFVQTLRAFDRGGAQAAAALVSAENGTLLMDQLRGLLQELDGAEAAQLDWLESRADADGSKAVALLAFTLAAGATIFGLLLRMLRRESVARARAEALGREIQAGLAQRVEHRTRELGENQRRFVELFELAPDALVMVDDGGMILQVNRQAEAVFGWPRDELLGLPARRLLPVDLPGLLAERQRCGAEGDPVPARADLRGRRRDGTDFPLDISLAQLSQDGRPALLAAIRDTTERERLDRAVRESEALHRRTVDNMLEGSFAIGFDWRLRHVSAAGARQLRQPRDRLLGCTLMDVFPGIEASELFQLLKRCMDQRVPQNEEIRFEFGDGESGWFQTGVQPDPEGIWVFSIDVTERRRAEEELRAGLADLEQRVARRTAELVTARQAAEEANRAKSAFLATMSHEIRTPMNGVVGMVDVLARTRLSEDQADAVRTIRASAFALLGLIDDILDFSKIEAGRMELERVPVALPELIEGVCETLLAVAADKEVELNLFVSPQLPGHIWSDPTRLRQLLYNLAGNAIKFSAGNAKRKGRVSVRATLGNGPSQLVVRIQDNGIGMAPETLDRLFSTFMQGETSTTRRFGGTGLGVAICGRLVKIMGGAIKAHSVLNRGATFVITLPIEAAAGQSAPPLPDLAGVDGIVVATGRQAGDLLVYLEHAGLRARAAASLEMAADMASDLMHPVVVSVGPSREAAAALVREAFAEVPDARHVLLAPGNGRSTTVLDDGLVQLDGRCLRRDALLRAVAVAAGLASPESPPGDTETSEPEAGAGPSFTVAEARAQGRLILVAEDNELNQKVILRQIRMLGYTAEIAVTGIEALRLWHSGHFALVLTDLHMPEMDGYALAEAIRFAEVDLHPDAPIRTPILALTANAMRGEALRARAAGIDEYLTKPMRLDALKSAIERWLPAERIEPPPQVAAPADATPPAVELHVLRDLIGDDPELQHRLLAEFLQTIRGVAAELRAAERDDDLRRIAAIAHKHKAASRSVGAKALGDSCAELENACRGGSGEHLRTILGQFEVQLQQVERQLGGLVEATETREGVPRAASGAANRAR